MSIVFCDSYDHYDVIADKWSQAQPNASIDLTGTKSRTGIGCLIILGAARVTYNVVPTQKLIVGDAYYSDAVVDQNVIWLGDTITPPFSDTPVRVWVTSQGALRVTTGNDPFTVQICQSIPNLFHFGAYNYIEVRAFGDAGGNHGTVDVYCNGALVTGATGVSWHFALGGEAFGNVQLVGAGGFPDCRHDDTYIIDWSNPAGNNITPLGPVRLYAGVPDADVSLTWTPLAGTNFSEVNEIPPDGDTSYNFSGVVGDADQYRHPVVGIPANSRIFAVQHCLDMRLDSGMREVASDMIGVQSPTSAILVPEYKIYTFPFDLNPNTDSGWVGADFPVNAGPIVSA